MAILKCKMCGGDLMVEAGMTVAECEYCGTKQTVPSADNEKKLTLFGRASRLRFACEFDKAAGVYETIVADFPEEAEAYWGLVLCSYGIEYVDDPATGKKIPTCHRSSFDSVMDDSNFEQALENADATARAVYREEAKAIEELRKGIIEVSSREEPYDIFICYKETDEKGDRTIDSVIAQDVYDALTDKGYRVFFSRITLEDKLGQEYEPYIFAALNSAKVMLAFGTDYEYYNTVWVKNEWSRFLQLMTKDKSKHLIPCYKGIDAYDMPKEFAKLQAQDMGKVGAIQDLLRGIEKLLPRETQKEVVKETVVVGAAANTASLLKRAFMFLEDGEWVKADDFCEQVLNINPECAEAYLGKLMAEIHVKKQEDLRNCDEPFDGSNNYQKAIRFGNNELVAELNGYIAQINTRKENARLDGIYNDAVKAMNSATSIKEYEAVVQMFESISQWKDSADKISFCNVKIEEIKDKEEIDRIERDRQAEIKRKQAETNAKRTKKIAAIAAPIICVAIAFVIVLSSVIIPNGKYNDAIALMETQQYTEAIAAFEVMDGYKDSVSKIEECHSLILEQRLKNAKIGDSIVFGSYEQDNNITNGEEEIEWLILDKQDDKVLVISKYGLDARPINGRANSSRYISDFSVRCKWETSTIRNWLSEDFINDSFSEIEKALIPTVNVAADKNPSYDTSPGYDTQDKVFLLSIVEANKYFSSDEMRQCNASAYAISNGAVASRDNGNCYWWLRTPGEEDYYFAYVDSDGTIANDGNQVKLKSFTVRPAMWIDLSEIEG